MLWLFLNYIIYNLFIIPNRTIILIQTFIFSEDNITTFLTMRSHFKKIYDVKPIVKCWSDACPNKRLLKNTINIRDFQ
jgi:hypothetical protein